MIKLKKGNMIMGVCTKVQASAFLKSGYEIVADVEDKPTVKVTVEATGEKYTKTEINRMTTSYLQELATKEGIAGAEDMTGSELKKLLIEKFGL